MSHTVLAYGLLVLSVLWYISAILIDREKGPATNAARSTLTVLLSGWLLVSGLALLGVIT